MALEVGALKEDNEFCVRKEHRMKCQLLSVLLVMKPSQISDSKQKKILLLMCILDLGFRRGRNRLLFNTCNMCIIVLKLVLVLNVNCFQVNLGCGHLSLNVIFDKLSCASSLHRDSGEQCKMSELEQSPE